MMFHIGMAANGRTVDCSTALTAAGHSGVCLGGQMIQERFELQTFGLQLRRIPLRRHPQGWSPQEETACAGIGHHEAVPTRKEFFFEQLKASGMIGSLEARAS